MPEAYQQITSSDLTWLWWTLYLLAGFLVSSYYAVWLYVAEGPDDDGGLSAVCASCIIAGLFLWPFYLVVHLACKYIQFLAKFFDKKGKS